MGKYLKLFNTTADYQQYESEGILTPNVSYVKENCFVGFHPYIPPPTVVATYNATSGNLYALRSTTGVEQLFVDDVEVTDFGSSYSFSTEGEHTVRVVFSENSGIPLLMFSATTVTSVDINDEVTSIGPNAFFDCTKLTGITIPDSITYIGQSAFYNCSGLTGTLVIPESVTSIGSYAFYGCSGLTGELVIPDSVTSIGNEAFRNCLGLTEITIGSGVTTIVEGVFRNCSGLTGITIPESVTSIGSYAFYGCKGLTNITIPNSVTNIGGGAFYNCSGLTEITIGSGVTSIGNYAFFDCSGLTSIICYAPTAPSIQNNAFYDIKSNGTLYYPAGADYSSWNYYLGEYNWTGQEIAS